MKRPSTEGYPPSLAADEWKEYAEGLEKLLAGWWFAFQWETHPDDDLIEETENITEE